ncbi:hypothetical protein QTP70_031977, partial [Hemibagrus guttatus]
INVCRNVRCGRGDCVFIDTEPFYECKCIAPFQPPNCRRSSPCNPSPCLNGGTCVKGRTRASFHCNCTENYSGKFCQVGPDDCYEGDGASYRGFVSETVSGHDCLPWNSHVISYYPDADDTEASEEEVEDDGIGQHNYCRHEADEMQVELGGVDLEKHESADQTLAVQSYILHENYTEIDNVQYNDIALLKLKPVTEDGLCARETRYVKSACLPPGPFPDGMECSISGFGVTEKDERGSSQLLDTKVLLINQNRCMAPNVLGDLLDDSMLCAGRMQGGIDACHGDSGGPLICKQNDTHYIYGVVSWGDGCGKKNKPGVYARVTKFLDWINEKMRSTLNI